LSFSRGVRFTPVSVARSGQIDHTRGIATDIKDGRRSPCAAADRRPVEEGSQRSVEAHGLGEDQLAAAPDAPAVVEIAGGDLFTHRQPSEHDRLDHEEAGVRCHFGIDPPLERRA
jgi:hypothetical protein